jgi:hypothetical protein
MATATITLTDDGVGGVDVRLSFGAETDPESDAHVMAMAMVQSQMKEQAIDLANVPDCECGHG